MDIDLPTVGLVAFLVLSFLYLFLFAFQLALWFFVLLFTIFIYLALRFVRAVETIAEHSKRPETDADE